jgi:Zn ribbon nucleic-acid-binding protein
MLSPFDIFIGFQTGAGSQQVNMSVIVKTEPEEEKTFIDTQMQLQPRVVHAYVTNNPHILQCSACGKHMRGMKMHITTKHKAEMVVMAHGPLTPIKPFPTRPKEPRVVQFPPRVVQAYFTNNAHILQCSACGKHMRGMKMHITTKHKAQMVVGPRPMAPSTHYQTLPIGIEPHVVIKEEPQVVIKEEIQDLDFLVGEKDPLEDGVKTEETVLEGESPPNSFGWLEGLAPRPLQALDPPRPSTCPTGRARPPPGRSEPCHCELCRLAGRTAVPHSKHAKVRKKVRPACRV